MYDDSETCVSCGFGCELGELVQCQDGKGDWWWIHEICRDFKSNEAV